MALEPKARETIADAIDSAETVAGGEIALATGSTLIGAAGVGAALDVKGDGKITVGNGTTATSVAVSGDIALTNAGVTTIQPGAVDPAMLADGALAADVTGRAKMAADFFDAATADAKFAAGAIGEDLLTAAELTGRAAAVVASANVIGGLLVVHRIVVPSGADGDVDVVLTHKTRVIDYIAVLAGAGTAGSVLTVKSTATAIGAAHDVSAGNDKAVYRATTIDDAVQEIAAAGTLRVSKASTGADFPGATVDVIGYRVA